jgi:ADP-ribosylglycohydrolase
MERVDRFRGSILGLAVGDALGHPTEFISSVEGIKRRFGPEGIKDFSGYGGHPPGTFTDDTQMTVGVLRALVRKGHASLDELMECMGDEFVAWSRHRENNRAPGGTCLTGCRNFETSRDWKKAGVKQSKGCGAAMRAAPVGLFCDDDEQLVRLAAAQSVLTHSHPTGIASSVAAAAAVAHVVRRHTLDGLLDFVTACVERCDESLLLELGATPSLVQSVGNREQLALLEKTRAALGEEHEDVCRLLGGAWVGEEAVATALWCVLKAQGDFEGSVRRGANSSGDSDSIATIAGSIAGALVGAEAIDQRYRTKLEKAGQLDVLARYLWWVAQTGADVPSLPGPLDFFGTESAASRGGPKGDDLDDRTELEDDSGSSGDKEASPESPEASAGASASAPETETSSRGAAGVIQLTMF